MKKMLRAVKIILLQKILNSKTAAVFIIQIFIMRVYTKGLVNLVDEYQYPCSIWILPFYCSALYVLLINMFEVIYWFSDVPNMQYAKMYQIIRCGRKTWGQANCFAIIVQGFLYMVVVFLISIICLIGRIDFTLDWGKLLYTIALQQNKESMGVYLDISYDSMVLYHPLQLLALQIMIGVLVISFIGLMMYAVSLWKSRLFAIFLSGVMTVMCFFVDNSPPIVAKLISYVTPVCWMLTTRIGKRVYGLYTLPPLPYILIFLITGIGLWIGLIMKKSKCIEFEFYKED